MITPTFSCSQSHQSLVVDLYCPAVRASDLEVHVQDTLLSVHINPYFLRLSFSDSLIEDDNSSARYDAASGHLILTLSKQVQGKEFKDLDLLAKLLAPAPTTSTKTPLIEVLSSKHSEDGDLEQDILVSQTERLSLNRERQEILEASRNDWQLPQAIPPELPYEISVQKRYGFLDMYSGYFNHVSHSENEVNELGQDAETCPVEHRIDKRLKDEQDKWDQEHYIADFADDAYILELISWQNPFLQDDAMSFVFTEQENLTMLGLPRKEYLTTPERTQALYLTLLTILFSFLYEAKATQNDFTSESAWTMCTLTPAFSALNPPPYPTSESTLSPDDAELEATLVASYRRSFAFPLYRSFAFAESCRKDIAQLCRLGKRPITRCLLRMKDILDHHDVYYIYSSTTSSAFLQVSERAHVDFCISDETLHDIGARLETLVIRKDAIGWDLEELEAAVLSCQEGTDSDSVSSDSSD